MASTAASLLYPAEQMSELPITPPPPGTSIGKA